MSDEKRQTRLLPFRLRRAGASRRAGRGEFNPDARDEFDHDARGEFDAAKDFAADAELTALLRSWEAPPPTRRASERLLADFRACGLNAPLWRRAFASELRVPLPIAACAVFALLLSLCALGTRGLTRPAPFVSKSAEPTAVRVVEVPVVRERVVTRTVYVEKKERGAARGVSGWTDVREAVAADAAERKQPLRPPTQAAPAGYFTRVDMADFQPANEVKIRIVKRGRADEK
jgi:hypothetical protein